MVNVMVPFVFSGYYQGSPHNEQVLNEKLREGGFVVGDQIYPPESDPPQTMIANKTPQFRNVKVMRLQSTGQSQAAGFITGLPEAEIQDMYFADVFVEAQRGVLIRHANVQFQNLNIEVQSGEKLIKQINSKVIGTLKSQEH
jgi:hypothetical protein